MATKGAKMKITEINGITGEITTRDATVEEIKQNEIDLAVKAKRESDEQAKAQAKTALLERLGITAEEAALLLG